MKSTEKKKPVNTIPKGVWESSRPSGSGPSRDGGKETPATKTTDLQGNGYPEKQSR